jgi:acetoin utilization protein AcuB
MDHGHFRHLPVVDEHEKLIGMLSDRDIRLIRPSLAFTSKEEAAVQLWSISVQQAAVFDPISVKPDSSLREAAELMLRWHVGGLPVVDDHGNCRRNHLHRFAARVRQRGNHRVPEI